MKIKICPLLLLLVVSLSINAQVSSPHQLIRTWETDTVLAEPESVVLLKNKMYVSLVDGQANDKDGKGGVAIVGLDGKVLNGSWVTGLNGPTGMALWKNRLYIANIDEVIVIDTATAKIITTFPVPNAKGLNDVAIDHLGVVYISDPQSGSIYRILNQELSHYLSGVPGVNGLLTIGNDLYMVTTKQLLRYGADKQLHPLVNIPKKGADGLTKAADGDFLFTIYTGLVYYLHKNGKTELLLSTEGTKTGSADIAYDPEHHVLYVPTLFRKSIAAYQLH